jgi:hypothetical protein
MDKWSRARVLDAGERGRESPICSAPPGYGENIEGHVTLAAERSNIAGWQSSQAAAADTATANQRTFVRYLESLAIMGAYAALDLERARAAPPCRAPRRLKRPRPAEGRAHAGCPLPHPFERCAIRVRSGCWISSAWVEFLPALPKAAPANAIQEKRAPKERDDPMVSYPTDGDDSILGTSGPDRINEKSGLADSACQKSPGRDSRRRTRRFRRSSRPTSLVGPLSGDAVQWPRVTRVTRRHRGRLRP